MKRRDFIRSIAASGLALNLPLLSGQSHADAVGGRYMVMVNAGGGWDPTSICDVKGTNGAYGHRQGVLNQGNTNNVNPDPSKKVGDIQWSSIPDTVSSDETVLTLVESQYDRFFTTYGERMTVINGIDTATNNHHTGSRYIWSGNSDVSHPALAALFAATVSPSSVNLPMAFLSNGGFDYTGYVVARARAKSVGFFSEISSPNRISNTENYLPDGAEDIYAKIFRAQQERLERQISSEPLQRKREQLSQLFGVRSASADLEELLSPLSELQSNVSFEDHWTVGQGDGLKQQAQLVAAAFKADLAAGATLHVHGFDTHGEHDSTAYSLAGQLFEGVHYLMVALDYLGIREKTTVVIGSDFGRTPYYNAGAGKDHWPLTSMLVIHGDDYVTGGRTFGATTSDFNGLEIDPQTGKASDSGLILNPGHVNAELRKLLGISEHSLAKQFSVPESNFNIFV